MDTVSDTACRKIKDLARQGIGVAWNPIHKEYWPFEVDGETINWWHDPEGCNRQEPQD